MLTEERSCSVCDEEIERHAKAHWPELYAYLSEVDRLREQFSGVVEVFRGPVEKDTDFV